MKSKMGKSITVVVLSAFILVSLVYVGYKTIMNTRNEINALVDVDAAIKLQDDIDVMYETWCINNNKKVMDKRQLTEFLGDNEIEVPYGCEIILKKGVPTVEY